MKISKLITGLITVLLIAVTYLFTSSRINSTVSTVAPTVKVRSYDAGQEFYTSWSALDSTKTSFPTDYTDMSTIDGQLQGAAMTITYSYTTPGGTSDSALVSLMGKDANDIEHVLGTTLVFGSTTGAATLTTLSVTRSLAFCGFKITNNQGTGSAATNRNCTGFTLSGYFPKVDDIPPAGKIDFPPR